MGTGALEENYYWWWQSKQELEGQGFLKEYIPKPAYLNTDLTYAS